MYNHFDFFPEMNEAIPSWGVPNFIIVTSAPGVTDPIGTRSLMILKPWKERGLYFTNLVKTPHNHKKRLTKKLLKEFSPRLFEELKEIMNPESRILAIGPDVAKLLCPGFSSLREDHGTIFHNPELDCVVVPTFHFSVGAFDPSKRRYIDNDLNRFFNPGVTSDNEFSYEIITEDFLNLYTDEIIIDIETTGLDPLADQITSIGLSEEGSFHVQILMPPFNYQKIFERLEDKTMIGHNLSFDLAFLETHSQLRWTSLPIKDTMLMAYVLGEEVLSLKHLVSIYTNRPGSHGRGGFEDPEYLAEDVLGTQELYPLFSKKTESLYISNLLNELSPFFVRMRSYGVHIDWNLHEKLSKEYLHLIEEAKKELDKIAEINWNSPMQVAPVLLKSGVPLKVKTPTGNHSVSEPVLRQFEGSYPAVDTLLNYRDLTKSAGYLVSYKELGSHDGSLHPKLSLIGTTTGRLSCSDPNLQQVPRVGPIKTLFTSRYPQGYIGLVDLAQAELRIAALLSDDDLLAEALMKEDVHRFIASKIYQLPEEEISAFQRKKSKGVTFGLLYGGSPAGLAERVGVEESEVKKLVKDFFGLFPKLGEYIEDQKELVFRTGQSTTPLGRIRNLSTILEVEGVHSAERKAINTPIQGTASDVMLIIMKYIFTSCQRLQLNSYPIFGVHDSSLHDIRASEKEIYYHIVSEAFKSLNETPLKKLPLWNTLPITGELILGKSWANVESTNEENYAPQFKYPCSNLS